jgi:cold shock CspA family protein
MGERLKGRIKEMSDYRNFGYILGEDGKEIFLHHSDCCDFTPAVGALVEYSLGQDRMGRVKAINITERANNDKAN